MASKTGLLNWSKLPNSIVPGETLSVFVPDYGTGSSFHICWDAGMQLVA
jgi:hypothetical protein